MVSILGIDPGSRCTGYGIIHDGAKGPVLVAYGVIRTDTDNFPARLKQIYDGIYQVAREHHPTEMAIERVFMSKNADSALKLGQARGAAICAGMNAGLPVFEYAAREVKLSLVGKGSAEKSQVQHMVRFLLGWRCRARRWRRRAGLHPRRAETAPCAEPGISRRCPCRPGRA